MIDAKNSENGVSVPISSFQEQTIQLVAQMICEDLEILEFTRK